MADMVLEVMTWDTKEKQYRDLCLWYDSPDKWSHVGRFEGEALVYRLEQKARQIQE